MQNRRTSMPSAGLEPLIPAVDRLHDYTLDGTTTGIDRCVFRSELFSPVGMRRCSRSWSVIKNRKKFVSNFQNRNKIGDFEKLVFHDEKRFVFSFSVIIINFHIRNMTEGWAVGCVKERKDVVPTEILLLSFLAVRCVHSVMLVWSSSFSRCRSGWLTFWPIFVLFLRFGPPGILYANFAHYMGGEYIPTELITNQPYNLRFFGVSQSYENV